MVGCRTGPKSALNPTSAPDPAPTWCATPAACAETVTVRSLGVGGFVVRYNSTAVLTPPLFTRGGLMRVAFGYELRSSPRDIDRALDSLGEKLGDVGLVLVGHSHYDHLMDLPHIANWYLPRNARIVGSATMKHLLRPAGPAYDSAVVIGERDVGSRHAPGTWIYSRDGRARAMALRSSHPNNVPGIMIAPGKLRRDQDTLPSTAWGWKLGDVFAFVVDFIDPADSTPLFRFVYHDAPPDSSLNGLPPFTGRDAHKVNLFIICGGNFDGEDDYPRAALAAVNPARVVVGHWENFFRRWGDSVAVIPYLKTEKLRHSLDAFDATRWVTPLPGATMKFAFSK
jgi:hypothetical protein